MAEPRAFVSFDFDHDEMSRNLFVGQAKKSSPTPFTVQDWSSRSVLPQRTWQEAMKKRIGATNVCIVLVGRLMGSATGVAAEIVMAKEKNVPIFGVYVNGANRLTALPKGLPRYRTFEWEWPKIAGMVRIAMTERKNA